MLRYSAVHGFWVGRGAARVGILIVVRWREVGVYCGEVARGGCLLW